MTTLELAIDPFRGYFLPWRQSSVRVVVKSATHKSSPFSGTFYGFFFRLFASILSFALASGVTLGVYYLSHSLLVRIDIEPKIFGVAPIAGFLSLCFLLNIILFVISILKTITELITELWKSSNAELQDTHPSAASI
jgi:hypothetical protein